MMKRKKIILPILLIICSNLYAIEEHDHEHPRNEIGLSAGANYEITHGEWKGGIHAHYFRVIKPHLPWAIGIGAEYVFGEEIHYGFTIGARYEVIKHLQISLMPGIIFIPKPQFSIHAEVAYELIQLGSFHLGPVVGYAWSNKHSHCSVGVHAAFAFN